MAPSRSASYFTTRSLKAMRIIAGARRLLRNQPRPRSRSTTAKNNKESLMSLPQAAITFLNHNAATNSAAPPKAEDDLFQIGALDSFALVDFINVLEEHCGIKVPDADVNAETFRTIEAVERYVAARNETC